MFRIPRSLTLLSLLLLTLAASGPGVAAQDDPMAASAAHPLVGAWIAESSPDDPTNPLEVVIVGPGGTVTDASVGGVGSGAWAPTGERTADVTFVFPAPGPEGTFAGFVTVRSSVEVAEDGLSFAGTYTLESPAALSEAMGMSPGPAGTRRGDGRSASSSSPWARSSDPSRQSPRRRAHPAARPRPKATRAPWA